MSNKLDNVYRLQKKDIHRAAVMLADAFQLDPVWNAVFGDYMSKRKTPGYCQKHDWMAARLAGGLKPHMIHEIGGRMLVYHYLQRKDFDKLVV